MNRGYFSIVALQDDNALQTAPLPRPPSKGKGPCKGKDGKKGRLNSNIIRYSLRSGGKAPNSRAWLKAAIMSSMRRIWLHGHELSEVVKDLIKQQQQQQHIEEMATSLIRPDT